MGLLSAVDLLQLVQPVLIHAAIMATMPGRQQALLIVLIILRTPVVQNV